MKLATYYKIEENNFCRLVDLEETELAGYDKIYFFSEQEKQPIVPPQFLRANNVIFGGTAFTNGKYIPFDNELIDYTLPRPAIYKEFLKEKYNSGTKAKAISHILDDTYYRNYAGDKPLPLPAILPRKRVILYDKEFFYPDWKETIETITERKCSTIIRVHPIVCHTMTEYFDAREQPKLNRSNSFIFDLNVPLDETSYMFKHFKNRFLADIGVTSNVFIPIGGSYPTKKQYIRDIEYKLNLLFCFWSRGIPMKIKLMTSPIGVENPFEEIEKNIERWSSKSVAKKGYEKTILETIPKNKKYDYLREQYNEFIKYNPNSNRLFNSTYPQIKKGGLWRYEY